MLTLILQLVLSNKLLLAYIIWHLFSWHSITMLAYFHNEVCGTVCVLELVFRLFVRHLLILVWKMVSYGKLIDDRTICVHHDLWWLWLFKGIVHPNIEILSCLSNPCWYFFLSNIKAEFLSFPYNNSSY